jgi:hypothetical protein
LPWVSNVLPRPSALAVFKYAPFADERNRYLSHCAANGARPAALKVKRSELLAAQVRARLDAEGVHLGHRLWTHAVKLGYRKARHEGFRFVGHDGELAVRLELV